ncbi:nucleoside diphosphate kinase, partial [Mucor mucedo]|uniref:nucleoside diphosphate kinase n=1 Tax=Mucor mucedo TaxID=29922 RepID=UPI00221E3E6B
QERTLALITSTEDLPAIRSHIENQGFTIIKSKTIQLSSEQAQAFYEDHLTQSYYDKMVRWLGSGSNICALVLEKKNAIQDWKSLMGPAAYKKARKNSPNSIRALFGKDTLQNATHGSDSEASFKKEIDFIFSDSVLD